MLSPADIFFIFIALLRWLLMIRQLIILFIDVIALFILSLRCHADASCRYFHYLLMPFTPLMNISRYLRRHYAIMPLRCILR